MTDLPRLRDLFDALLEIPEAQREAWFGQHGIEPRTRAELLQLIKADASRSGLLDQASDAPTESLPAAPMLPDDDPAGRCVGPFRILSRLGAGGMASVYLAARQGADFEQTVALKLLRHAALSEMELTFFRRERQVLARLSHPNIARLIDGGVSADGTPYLAMEYVSGVSITRWCRDRALSLDERVALLAKVARAVAAAHAALVVHRDIKPANVLVDAAGEPRLLDFGIAKMLEPEAGERTHPGLAPMTPEYAAPEQFSGGVITTATDVYALGVLLYELLTGERPDRTRLRAPSQALLAQRTDTGSTTTGLRIGRDLDRITLMALAEEPAHRYPGAAALAEDLDRYLERQPVRAHPPSAWYRTRKFVERHRGGVALTALLVLGILTSLALALSQARVARQQAERATTVQQFLIGAVESARAVQPRDERPSMQDVVKAAAARVDDDIALDPSTRAELLLVLGKVALSAGDLDGTGAMLDRAREAAARLPASDPVQWPLRVWAARLKLARSDTAAALALLDEAARLPRPADAAEALDADLVRATALYLAGKPDEAARAGEAVVAAAERSLAHDPEKMLEYRFTYGELLSISQQYGRAIEVLRVGIERHRALGLKPRLSYLSALAGLAQAEARVGNLDRARDAAEGALLLSREIFDPPHPHIARALSTLGVVSNARGETARSAEVFREALEMRRALLGPDDPNLIPAILNVGATEALLGRDEAALALFLEARRACEAAPANTRSTCGAVRHRSANAYQKLGRLDEALHEAEASLALRREVFGAESGEVAASLALLANIARLSGRTDAALAQSEQAEQLLQRNPDISRNIRAEAGISRVRALSAAGRDDEALRSNDQLLAWWRGNSPDEKLFLLQMLGDRAGALFALGRRDEAKTTAEQALALGLTEGEIGIETLQRLRAAAGEP
jgi:eukaryotic-like serine/threonine-protein kinase